MAASTCYDARVMHRRGTPFAYRFRYRVFSLLLDVDELDDLSRRLRLFSRNRFNLISFHDRDFGPGDGSDLRRWAEGILRVGGIEPDGGPVRILCFPRVFGHGFNPLSVWYCHRCDGRLLAMILEVRNTFGEKHQYLLPVEGTGQSDRPCWQANKTFHVSPFLPAASRYRFALTVPGRHFLVRIEERAGSDPEAAPAMMTASWSGVRRRLNDAWLLRMALRLPPQGLKIVALIHWHAFRLWLRGAPIHARPDPPEEEVTNTCPSSNRSH